MTVPLTGRIVKPTLGRRPVYEATVPIPWRLRPNTKDSPEYGGMHWWNQCGRKRAHFTEEEALMKAKLLRKRRRRTGMTFEAYHCPWCEWYHLGHRIIP